MGELGFHGRFADEEFVCDFGVRSAGGDEFEYFDLPAAEGDLHDVHAPEESRGDDGYEGAFPGGGRANGRGQFVGRSIFQEVAVP